MLSWWKLYYWGSFFLNWTIMPFLIGYLQSGAFTVGGRIARGLRENLQDYCLYSCLFLCLCSYLYLSKRGKQILVEADGLTNVVIGLSIWANLLWLATVVGYGIVRITQQFYKRSSLEKRLKHYQYRTAYYDRQMIELAYE